MTSKCVFISTFKLFLYQLDSNDKNEKYIKTKLLNNKSYIKTIDSFCKSNNIYHKKRIDSSYWVNGSYVQ